MNQPPPPAPPARLIQPIAELFTSTTTALWATTYNLDLGLFNEFLLPRLGDPPLNIAVLADQAKLARSLDRIPPERVDSLAHVNRRWLLRAVHPGSGVFHPKTYLALRRQTALLLVGSGNLSMPGLDQGREVFTEFQTGTTNGDSAILTWTLWVRRLIEHVADTTLADRFRHLEERLTAIRGLADVGDSPLLHNLDTPLADQLANRIAKTGETIDELLLTAPYYDRDAAAVQRLIHTLKPRTVRVFVTSTTSVDGPRLRRVLEESSAKIEVATYHPDDYVHAKIVGVITSRRAWLLSGSANLSRAALTLTPAHGGNVEICVLTELNAQQVRDTFIPPETTTIPGNLDDLHQLEFTADEEPGAPPIRLTSASSLPDGRLQITTDLPPDPTWLLDDLQNQTPLDVKPQAHTATTAQPCQGRLVHLVDQAGQVMSNRVVVDDPAALHKAMHAAAASTTSDRPTELTEGDLDSALGRGISFLHRHLVMDVTERAGPAPGRGIAAAEESEQADDELWERLEREQLAHDARAGAYAHALRRDLGADDPLFDLLAAFGARVPATLTGTRTLTGLAQVIQLERQDDQTDVPDEVKPTRHWRSATRVRVRARNVLRRWAAAQTDPRLLWVDPLAPAVNIAWIAIVVAVLWLRRTADPDSVELTPEDLDDIWSRWLTPFLGTGAADGWFARLPADSAEAARQRLPGWLPETVAALCWLAIRPGADRRQRILTQQATLGAAIDQGLLDVTEETAQFLSLVMGRDLSRTDVERDLLEAVTFLDDDLWCARTAETLDLTTLALKPSPGSAQVRFRLEVTGIPDPLTDPRLPRLIHEARRYRESESVAVFALDAPWRLVVREDGTGTYMPALNSPLRKSVHQLTRVAGDSLVQAAGVLWPYFPEAQSNVS